MLAYHPGQQLLVIHARGAPHQGAFVEAIVREDHGRLVLKAPLADSPERNLHERIWKWLRRVVTHHHWCATLTESIEVIRHFFRCLAGINDQVRQRCSFDPLGSLIASL